ncbi:hypothetical protein XBFM1_1310065 [Xenorhabdus bovienii str. feltiae Moldova]|uniref:Uncharacterized protein n=1 Tax=Xenorhabdus bovienii str. feltiae Moldova TaxID=1398200 RepID=A0A077NMQ1_XENBV|nr:hypothetical protein XBFM1_1310065 [Xenorhabdus bovienii str. feltiae Moldova]
MMKYQNLVIYFCNTLVFGKKGYSPKEGKSDDKKTRHINDGFQL